MKRFKLFLTEIAENKRVGIEHFQQMKPLTFVALMKKFQSEFKGILKTGSVKFKEKFDGFGAHLVWDGSRVGIEKSFGVVFDLKSFSNFDIQRTGKSSRISNEYDNLLERLQTNKELNVWLKKNYPKGIKIYCEILINPLGTVNGEKIKFIVTEYDINKLGKYATVIVYGFKDLDGNKITTNIDTMRDSLISTVSSEEFRFFDDTTPIKTIDINIEVDDFLKMLDEYDDVEDILTSRTKASAIKKEALIISIQKWQEEIGRKIVSNMKHGKLGDMFEGLIIELADGKMYKLTSDKFKIDKKSYTKGQIK